MKYIANPVEVQAFKITSLELREARPDSEFGNPWGTAVLENGETVIIEQEMTARYRPVVGDYWVIQEDGYTYLNPKEVFERKYSAFEVPEHVEVHTLYRDKTYILIGDPNWISHEQVRDMCEALNKIRVGALAVLTPPNAITITEQP